jgi:protein O-GlcNAc transferase
VPQTTTHNASFTTGRDPFQALLCKGDRAGISLDIGELPDFLRAAHEAVLAGRLGEARDLLSPRPLRAVREVLRKDPSRVDVMFVVAGLLLDSGQYGQAESWYRSLLTIESHPSVYNRLAQICSHDMSRLTEAVTYSRKALDGEPDNVVFRCILGRDLIQAGQITEGVNLLARAVDQSPKNQEVRSCYLWHLHFLPDQTRQSLSEGYRRWGRDFAPSDRARRNHQNVPDPHRRLRVGYLSPDFRRDSVSLMVEPVLDGHDRAAVEVFGYGNEACPDAVTQRLQEKFDVYRTASGLDAETVARQIEEDRIDILVALAGHCTHPRLDVLAFKPAPIQVDLGSFDTTGMDQVDYRITDPILDSPGTESFYTEQLVHLPGGAQSFRPPLESPIGGLLPMEANGFVTFGSFHPHLDISSVTLSLWCEILRAVPDSQMILTCLAGEDAGVRESLWRRFQGLGIARERVHIYGELPHLEHLEMMGQVDLALDTYPFNGGMTTLEGLWMGVPFVTLTGQTTVSRVGLDILHRLGLEVFAASVPQEYVAKACAFARQSRELAEIRTSLRSLMLQSPMCRPKRMAGELEEVYRRMWLRWCEGGK